MKAEDENFKKNALALPIGFDWDAFEQEQRVAPGEYCVLLAYDGLRAGRVIGFQALGAVLFPLELQV